MSLGVLVDASVAVKWYVTEPDSATAERLLSRDVVLHAPTLLMTELANALWKNFRRDIIDRGQAQDALAGLRRTIAQWHDEEDYLPDALDLALRLDHPVYDLLYLALAERIGTVCVTADQRLVRRTRSTPFAGRVVHLADWRAA